MQIVIDIPEDVYEYAKTILPELRDNVWNGIANGTPLDKIRTDIREESKKNYTNNVFNKGLYRAIEIIDEYGERNGEGGE